MGSEKEGHDEEESSWCYESALPDFNELGSEQL